ncbi:MAG: cyclase [Planctomycetota bacterium]|jgi:cyclase
MKTLLIPLSFSGLLAGGLLLAGSPKPLNVTTSLNQDGAVQSAHVAGPVHILTGAGGNVGLSIGEDGVLLIDDKFAANEGPIRAAIKELGGDKIVYLVNTHYHGDHTGSNAGFGGEAIIVAHANVRARLSAAEGVVGTTTNPPAPKVALPEVTHENGLSLYFNGEEIRLLSFDHGHTDGDSVVWFTKSNVVHMGDLYFDAFYPYVDLGSGGGVLGLITGLEGVLATVPSDAKIISGHGRVTGTDELREYVAMIKTVLERVQEAMTLGETAQQMIDNGMTGDFDERWGNSNFMTPLKFVDSIRSSLQQKL